MQQINTQDNTIIIIIGTEKGINSTVVFSSEREFAQFLIGYDKNKFIIFKIEVMPPLARGEEFLIKSKYKY